MSELSRIPAVVTYLIPLLGWLYVFLFQRNNALAMYHLRQSIGLCLFLLASLVGWVVIAWALAWIPYLGILSVGLFAIVMAVYLFGIGAWVLGLIYALKKRAAPLPGFGPWAERLPIK